MTGHRFGLLLSRDGTKTGRTPGRRAAALAAAAAVVGGGMWLTVPAASAASPGCGPTCILLSNQKFGTADLPMVSGAATAAQPVVLSAASDSTAQDWTESFQGTVSDLYAVGLMNPTLDQHYGTDQTFQFEYTPGGIDSGLCLGVGSGPRQNTPVTLQPCGLSARTFWIWDTADAKFPYTPLISGNDAKYPAPYVLTANTAGDNLTTQTLKTKPAAAVGAQGWVARFGLAGTDWADSSFCSRPWGPTQTAAQYIGITYNGVAACGNADTGPLSNNQGTIYYTTPSGTTVYFDKNNGPPVGFQCVELAARYFYFETTQVAPTAGSGRQFVSKLYGKFSAYGISGAKGTSTFDSSLTAGNIISMWSSADPTGDGHVAVVTNVNVSGGTGTIDVIDENGGGQLTPDRLGDDVITVTGGQMTYYNLYDKFQWTTNLPGSV